LIGVNLEAMEWLSHAELLFLFGHEIPRIEGGYLADQQLPIVIPLLKNVMRASELLKWVDSGDYEQWIRSEGHSDM
jgi:hypothetical protein